MMYCLDVRFRRLFICLVVRFGRLLVCLDVRFGRLLQQNTAIQKYVRLTHLTASCKARSATMQSTMERRSRGCIPGGLSASVLMQRRSRACIHEIVSPSEASQGRSNYRPQAARRSATAKACGYHAESLICTVATQWPFASFCMRWTLCVL